MRATRSSVFIQAIIIALLAFEHEWAIVLGPLGILHLAYHWINSPRIVPAEKHGHYRVHHGRRAKSPRVPVNPTPQNPHWS